MKISETGKNGESPESRRAGGTGGRLRTGLGLMLSLAAAGLVIAVLALVLSGRSLPLPEFVRAMVEDRANTLSEDVVINLGSVSLSIERDGSPLIMMRDVLVAQSDGNSLAYLNSLGVGLSLENLVRGRVALSRMLLEGAQVTVRRDGNGRFSYRSQEDFWESDAEPLPGVLEEVDRFIGGPALSSLEEVRATGIVLTLEDARSGRIWQASNATAVLRRSEDVLTVSASSDVFSGTDELAQMQLSVSRSRDTGRVSLGAQVTDMPAADIALQSPVLSLLGVLDAPISGAVRTEFGANGELISLAGTLDIAQGALRPTEDVPPVEFDSARAYFTFDSAQQRILFSEVSLSGMSGEVLATGHVYLRDLDGIWPSSFLGQFRIERLTYSGDIFQAPLSLDDVRMDVRLRLDPFSVELAQLVVDNEGTPLRASGSVSARNGLWLATIDAMTDRVATRRVLELWPTALAPKTRRWVAENVAGGVLRNASAAVRYKTGGTEPEYSLSFEIEDGTARILSGMPALDGVRALATIRDSAFVLAMDQGGMTVGTGDRLDLAGSVFRVADLRAKPGQGIIEIDVTGSLTAVLTALNSRPLRVMERANQPPGIAEAKAEARAVVRLPLIDRLRHDDVTYQVDARIRNVHSELLVENRVFTSPELVLAANESGIGVAGSATLDDVPLTASWHQPFGADASDGGRIKGTVILSPETASVFGVPLPPTSIGGSAVAQFDLALPLTGPARLDLASDLKGIAITVPEIEWRKPAEAVAILEAEATLGDEPKIERLAFSGDGLSFVGAFELSDGGLGRAAFDEIRIGDWVDVSAELSIGPGGAAAVITGGMLDLRESEFGDDGESGGMAKAFLDITLDRLIMSDSVVLSPFVGQVERGPNGFSGAIETRVNGRTEIAGRLVPTDGGTAIRIQSDDASGVLRDMGITPNAREGVLDLAMVPVPGAGGKTYDGEFQISDLRLRKAPAMAELLDAISVVGLLDQLDGPGIKFANVDGRFRLTPGQIRIHEAAAVGGSLGLSASGSYQLDTRELDVEGVISPVYFLNAIGSIFSRRGEGLFGFNYRVAGSTDDPKVSVNPLSILTPGMFREIFRANPPAEN
ncbi:MAG: hypothetical protein F4X97_03955 [Boseongicola sp. SB0662_bin_57]|nr:hypothetical protein [Boseongicola sp. SB0662_bin_57]